MYNLQSFKTRKNLPTNIKTIFPIKIAGDVVDIFAVSAPPTLFLLSRRNEGEKYRVFPPQ